MADEASSHSKLPVRWRKLSTNTGLGDPLNSSMH